MAIRLLLRKNLNLNAKVYHEDYQKWLLKNSSFENDELIGKSILLFGDEEGVKRLHEKIKPTLLSERAWQGEINVKRKDGTLFPTDRNCSDICTGTGEPEYLVAIYNDITDRKRS